MKKSNHHKGASPEMVRYTNPGIAREMSTANLNSGQPYQRPVKPSDVNALIRRWDPAYLSPIEVSFRDGSYNVINGQHRIEAMRKMNGGADVIVPCLIYTGLSYEQEAAMYYLLDKSSGRLKLSSAIKALLESGSDPSMIDIKQRIERAGLTWALDKPTGASYEIKPVRAVISAYHLLGSRAFSRMLGLLGWSGNILKSCKQRCATSSTPERTSIQSRHGWRGATMLTPSFGRGTSTSSSGRVMAGVARPLGAAPGRCGPHSHLLTRSRSAFSMWW